MSNLTRLSGPLGQRNQIDAEISRLIGRPAFPGHLAEFIAAETFRIRLHESATTKASDGLFIDGALAGKTVNVKYYARMQTILDTAVSLDPLEHADFYLVMTGPRGSAASSRGQLLDWSIAAVYLFDAHQLVAEQIRRGVKLGIASSVPHSLWTSAMVYPDANNPLLPVTDHQRRLLSLFASRVVNDPEEQEESNLS